MKNKLVLPLERKRGLIEPAPPRLSIARQCALVGFSRSSVDDAAQGERAEHLQLRHWWDEQDTRTPVYGIRRMTVWRHQQGDAVHPTRVARLLRTMGWETIEPKPRLRQPHPERRLDPDVLRGVPMPQGHQVWSPDLPSLRLHAGCVSLVAGLDWFSRSVLAWAVSMTLDGGCCLEAFEHALRLATPDIFHRDHGSQFTRADCTSRLETAGVNISLDGRGRALDHVCVERLWRTVHDEEVSLQDERTPREAIQGFAQFLP